MHVVTRRLLLTALAVPLLGVAATGPSALAADGHGPRQYYSHWQHNAKSNYHYRSYYYKPKPTHSGYKHHYVVRTPKDPKHVYFYNPYKKKYWGRCPVNYGEKPVYSRLAEKDQREKLDEIPESAFPAPGELPPVPESSDGALLDLPPDDLPESATPG